VFVVPRYARQAVAEGHRGERHIRRVVAGLPAVRIEQLSDSGSVRPFIRVLARLADIDPELRPDQGRKPIADSAKGTGEGRVGVPELPPVILSGLSRRSRSSALPRAVSAYADEPSPPKMGPPFGQPLNLTVVPRSVASQDTRQHVVIAKAGDSPRAILSGLERNRPISRALWRNSRAAIGSARTRSWAGKRSSSSTTVRINGHNVDPLQVKLSGGRALGGATLIKFLEAERSIDELIAAPTHVEN
jgi:hypothetical protein